MPHVVPLAPRLSYDAVKDFSQAIVQHLAQTIPARFVAKSGPANRVGRIFVDYLRNKHGATTAAHRAVWDGEMIMDGSVPTRF
jgi:bifunctional non-homologous end joining protein LigD